MEGFGGGLHLQTEIVTDSHRTICANDMFQSVSLQYSVLSARGLLACITAFICSNLLAYRGETGAKLLPQCRASGPRSSSTHSGCNLFVIATTYDDIL